MPEARTSSSSKSHRYTVRELIKANKMDNTDGVEKIEYAINDVQKGEGLCLTSRNEESKSILSSKEESRVSSNPSMITENKIRIDGEIQSVQNSNSKVTGSTGSVFHWSHYWNIVYSNGFRILDCLH